MHQHIIFTTAFKLTPARCVIIVIYFCDCFGGETLCCKLNQCDMYLISIFLLQEYATARNINATTQSAYPDQSTVIP